MKIQRILTNNAIITLNEKGAELIVNSKIKCTNIRH